MVHSNKAMVIFALLLCCLSLPTLSFADSPSRNIDLINQRGSETKNLFQRLNDWFEQAAPWSPVTTPLEQKYTELKNWISPPSKSAPVGPNRYEYAGPRQGKMSFGSALPVEFTPSLDALRYTPKDWKEVDYRKGKEIMTQQYFTHLFGNKEKTSTKCMGKKVYQPKKRKKRLGQIKFEDRHMAFLKNKLLKSANAVESKRISYDGSDSIWNGVKTDLATQGKQSSLLSLDYTLEGYECKQWLLAYKIEPCYVQYVGEGKETQRKAHAIYVLDLDPYHLAKLDIVEKACFRLFRLESTGQFVMENSFIESFDRHRPKKECGRLHPKTFVRNQRLNWYSMVQLNSK